MRIVASLIALASACGSKYQQPEHPYPLPTDNPDAGMLKTSETGGGLGGILGGGGSGAPTTGATNVEGMGTIGGGAPLDPNATPGKVTEACVPAGVYTLTWDFSQAKVSGVGGMTEELCRPMSEGLAQQGLSQMRVSYPSGAVTVEWAGPQTVQERTACVFQIATMNPAVAWFAFEAGKAAGTGAAAFMIETKNHPGERCDVMGARFTLVKTP